MNLPWVIYDGNGTTTQFNVPFPYLRKEHVKVKVDNNPVTFTWVNTSRIALASAPATDKKLVVERQTPSIPLYVIADGQPIPAKYHNEMLLQCMYRAEEKETVSLIAEVQQLVQQATAQKNAALAAKGAAETARDVANNAKNIAVSAQTQAEAAKNTAVSAKDSAVAANSSALSARDTAIAHKNAATIARNEAVAAKNEAVSAKNESVTAKNLSVNAKNEAITHKNVALTAKDGAVAAKDEAVAAAASASAIAGFDPANYLAKSGGTMTGEINSRDLSPLRLSGGSASSPAAFLHKNASDFYILLTDENNRDGNWNNLRPFRVNLTSGLVQMGCGLHVTAGDVTFSGTTLTHGEIHANNVNGIRFMFGAQSPAVLVRKDTDNFYLMLTDAGDRMGTFNSKRPFHFNLTTGRVGMAEGLNVANSVNISSGYLKVGEATYHANGNIKGAAWEQWHPSGDLKSAIAARITSEINAQPSGILDVRLAGTSVVSSQVSASAASFLPSGYVATGIRMMQGYSSGSYYNYVELHGKQVQVHVPGTGWRGVASV